MTGPPEWRAPGSVREAREIQEALRGRVVTTGEPGPLRLVAGLDAHYQPQAGLAWGAVALLTWPDLDLVESVMACRPLDFPYVPGLLSFREAPALLAALSCLSRKPNLIFVDGQGIAHPRRLGLACHIGVLTDIPAIGVAKSRLTGRYDEPGPEKGAQAPLMDKGEVIGAVLRTRAKTRPVFISVGHRIGLETAVHLCLEAAPRYRVPVPTRVADKISRMHSV